MLAAVVAAAGLGVTAWGTLMSARVAEDQLAQSRVQNEERERQQASRITYWQEPASPSNTVIANRSLDPAAVSIVVTDFGVKPYIADLGMVPPCSRVVIPETLLWDAHPKKANDPFPTMQVGAILIEDANGKQWYRSYDVLSPAQRDLPLLEEATEANEAVTMWSRDVKVEPLDECGSAN
ncbi:MULTISPECIES: hypothetical protein [unclassified Streptomyces]|uniref:hypothetical protein n=1 Tax=Streptomyces TaxID=1883 RepID=UPI00131DCC4D|nr:MULTISPECIES: hypothetical protein [unclassified Streptomyces]